MKRNRVLVSNDPEDVNQEWRNLVYAYPKSWLTEPVLVVFFAADRAPASIALPSLTQFAFAYYKGRAAQDRNLGVDGSADTKQLVLLETIDPSLSHHPHALGSHTASHPTRLISSPSSAYELRAPDGTTLFLDVATTEAARERGLHGQPQPKPHHGMLFVFSNADLRSFWMKQINYPLDLVFIDNHGDVTSIQSAAPAEASLPDAQLPIYSALAQYVLALPSNEASARGFAVGSHIDDLPPADLRP